MDDYLCGGAGAVGDGCFRSAGEHSEEEFVGSELLPMVENRLSSGLEGQRYLVV
jgi:hypothetical protein